MFIFGQSSAILFIDVFNWHYWTFALWFTPINWILSYFLNEWAFERRKINETKS